GRAPPVPGDPQRRGGTGRGPRRGPVAGAGTRTGPAAVRPAGTPRSRRVHLRPRVGPARPRAGHGQPRRDPGTRPAQPVLAVAGLRGGGPPRPERPPFRTGDPPALRRGRDAAQRLLAPA